MKTTLLSLHEVEERLHEAGLTDLNLTWIRNQIDRGNLPAVVVARKRRVRKDVLDRQIEQWLRKAA